MQIRANEIEHRKRGFGGLPQMIKNKILVSFILIILSYPAFSQLHFVPYDSIPLTANNHELKNPWAGGLNCPQFSTIDLDNDGFKDLVAFERGYYGVFRTFRNEGTADSVDYHYAPEFIYKFPHLNNWAMLADYNCDGHEDIFTSVPAGLKVYRNDFTPQGGNHFTLVTPLLKEEGLNGQEVLYVSPPDLPAISDVDGDGDLDILSYEILGNYVAYFKNMSMENQSNCDFLEYELKNACWGYFSEDATNNTINLYDTCDVNVSDPEKSAKHAGSTLLAFDANGDGVTDLAIGDISYKTMTLLSNGGTTTGSIMTQADYNFPSNSVPVNMTVFPAPFMIDVNNDGLKDLIVSANNPNTAKNYDNIWYYRNEGTNDVPEFVYQQEDFLQSEMLDVGEGAYASFFDENADGLMDIMVGNFGYYQGSSLYQSQIALLRNTGTADQPAFEMVTNDYGGFAAFGIHGMYPAFGDMDNDGDIDMIVGDDNGMLHYFRNDGGAGNPADFTLSQPNFKNIDIGQAAKPQIIDVNRDGLPDLLVGERSGTINYFQNIGTADTPDFTSNPTNDLFGGIDVMPECCTGFSAPQMVEDSTGNYMLYVGSEQGMLYLFNNIDGNIEGHFNIVDSLYMNGMNVNVSAFDINNDGKDELVTGNLAGGASFFKYGIPQGLGFDENEADNLKLQVYPNPARDYLYIDVAGVHLTGEVLVIVTDLYGNSVTRKKAVPVSDYIYFDTRQFNSGLYFINLRSGSSILSGKFIIQ